MINVNYFSDKLTTSLSPSAVNVNYNVNEANRVANQAMMQAAKKVMSDIKLFVELKVTIDIIW